MSDKQRSSFGRYALRCGRRFLTTDDPAEVWEWICEAQAMDWPYRVYLTCSDWAQVYPPPEDQEGCMTDAPSSMPG